MNQPRSLLAATLLVAALPFMFRETACDAADWPCFRGADGLAAVPPEEAKKLPTDFDGPTGKLIRWKTPITLPGESSPIVTGNRVFVTGANRSKRSLFCFEADSGKLLWQQDVGKTPGDPDADPVLAGFAAPTPATDGQRVVALFGNGDLAGFDLQGKQLWSKTLGVPESGYGFASSPIVRGSTVIIQFDHGTDASAVESSLLALDIATGKTLWKSKRPVRSSWTTPVIITAHDKAQIITIADPLVISYQLETGAELWRAKCMGADCAPSAAYANGIIFATVARSALTALKTDGTGDVTKTHILWKNEDDRWPEVPSPVSNGKQVFVALDTGHLVAYDAATGKQLWNLDRDTAFRSSPTLIGDQLWIFDREGLLHRIAAGPVARLLGTANLGEKTDAGPAYSAGRIYVRGKDNLYCIAAGQEQHQPDAAIEIADQLVDVDPRDRVTNRPHKVHVVKLQAGKTYVISLSRKDNQRPLSPWLRIEDSSFKQLVSDAGRNFVSVKVKFTPPKDDDYRIIASCRGGLGDYILRIAPDEAAISGVSDEGFLLRWLVLAPIPLAANETGAAALDREQVKDEAGLQPRAGQKVKVGNIELVWKEHVVDDYLLDFNGLLGGRTDDAATYAVTYVIAPEELKGIKMKAGSDDQLKVYLNGKEVMKFAGVRGAARDQDTAEVTLRKGVNVLVAKVVNEKGEWALCVRFTDKNDKPLTTLKAKTVQ